MSTTLQAKLRETEHWIAITARMMADTARLMADTAAPRAPLLAHHAKLAAHHAALVAHYAALVAQIDAVDHAACTDHFGAMAPEHRGGAMKTFDDVRRILEAWTDDLARGDRTEALLRDVDVDLLDAVQIAWRADADTRIERLIATLRAAGIREAKPSDG